jgi:hypothetical protein
LKKSSLTGWAYSYWVYSLIILLFAVQDVHGQEEESQAEPVQVELEMKDRRFLKGKVLGVQKDSATFMDGSNNIYRIALSEIKNIHYVDESSVRRKDWFNPPNRNRYLFSSSALPLKKGEIIISNAYLFLHSVQFGVSDKVTIGGGGDLFAGTIGYLTARVNLLKSEKHHFTAGGSLYFFPADLFSNYTNDESVTIGMVSAASTWGDASNNFTLGAGYMYLGNEFLPPIITIGATKRIAKKFGLVTENWALFVGEKTGIPVIISVGARYYTKRSTLDLALFSDSESVFGSFVPYIAYSITVGKLR